MERTYFCIDLKSFYASVECRERGLDPLTTNLVVADNSRTEKTVCLAVTPSLKQYGISGRARLFEVVQRVKEVNIERKRKAPQNEFIGASYNDVELKKRPDLKLDYIVATPRMAYYMQYSTSIYQIYLKYFAPEDIYAYSVDEVFCDATHYLKMYHMTAKELITKVIHDVYETTGITATGGIGTNMYLCKIAMDITAKHAEADENGVRIAELDEINYRKELWNHRPLTDFWRVGKGYSKKLEAHGIYTMGDIAKCSLENEDLLYRLFGINAELLIDHAWGWEPCTIEQIKAYKPINNSMSLGQVLHCPYNFEKAKLIVKEMTEQLSFDLVAKKVVTDQLVLTIEYDVDNLTNVAIRNKYQGEVTIDRYGRNVPKHAHGTENLNHPTASFKLLEEAIIKLYERIVNPALLVRRIYVIANHVVLEQNANQEKQYEQIDLFTDYTKVKKQQEKEQTEKQMQQAILAMKRKYGKNAVMKGMNLEEGATMKERNNQIGGHRA